MKNNLRDLDFNRSYNKGADNIASEFYLPAMACSGRYDRAVGYFRSSIYAIAWGSLGEFVANGGTMRIICSPKMAKPDIEAIRDGYTARSADTGDALRSEITEMLESHTQSKPTKILASLVAEGIAEFKIAKISGEPLAKDKRVFHPKLGIFHSSSDTQTRDSVAFKGSMNETWNGLANDGNIETLDVFVSWGSDGEKGRVQDEIDRFEELWETDSDSRLEVTPFPDIALNKLLEAADDDWEELLDEVVDEADSERIGSPDTGKNQRTPYSHQREALENWKAEERRGILKHATGSGKTFTAICAIRESLQNGEIPVILVPSADLLVQWESELKDTNQDLDPYLLVCGDGNTGWKHEGLLREWTTDADQSRIVLSTIQTARSKIFRKLISEGEHIFLIADEVHRTGSPENQNLFEIDTGPRLGLSATPERAGDPEGTEAIMTYFDGIVEPEFTLVDAIEAGRLTPYHYDVHTTELTRAERDEWDELSEQISVTYGRLQNDDDSSVRESEYLKRLLIKRADIVKQAKNKTELACEVIERNFESGDRWLIYCSNVNQLRSVVNRVKDLEATTLEYHAKMEGSRAQTLNYFEKKGGIIVSIKCLDEGVDIPNATHALILASSKNPREFVQRRGRVLRKSENKTFAHIHDAIVIPRGLQNDSDAPITSVLISELARAIQFAEGAVNAAMVAELKGLAIEAGVDPDDIAESGFESD